MNSKQSGGIVSFIIVLIALTGLFAGGLYLSKHQARVAHDSNISTPQVSIRDEQPAKDQSKDAKPTGQGSTDTSQPKQDNSSSSSRGDVRSSAGSSQSSQVTQQGASSSSANRVANTGPSDDIPATGPTDTLLNLGVLAGLVFAGLKAYQSRRSVTRSALNR